MRPHPIFFRITLLTLLALACAPLAGATPTFVQEGETAQIVGCETGTQQVAPRIYIQTFNGTADATGGIAGSPPRATIEVVPGKQTKTCIGIINRTGEDARIHLEPIDVAAGRPGGPAIRLEADSPFGVADWLDVPNTDDVTVKHGQILWVTMIADVPADATAGSYYSAIQANVIVDDAAGTSVSASVGVQVFFTVPGDAAAAGKIIDARAPRVIWWDGLELGKLPVLEKLRGMGIATIHFSWRNSGDLTDEVGGRVVIESDFGGKDVTRLDVGKAIVLRQADRRFRATWSSDIPIMGKFTPTIEMQGLDGRTSTHELDPIWVIPSWTYLLAVVLAVGIPLWWRRRSRRRYEELLARVEAAEARANDDDEDWDDTSI